jgi:hypothetical protein
MIKDKAQKEKEMIFLKPLLLQEIIIRIIFQNILKKERSK